MFKNYFTIIKRNLWAGRSYTFINVLGLGIGIAAMVWSIQCMRFKFSFNEFHPEKEIVYRVLAKVEGADIIKGYCPMPIGMFAKNDFASVKEYTRWEEITTTIKPVNSEDVFSDNIHYTDPSFFQLFHFPMIKGSSDLSDKSAILLTETTAKKYFGEKEALGQTLILHSSESYAQPLVVKGIVKDPPMNSSLQFGILVNINNYIKGTDQTFLQADDWKWIVDALFIKIPNKDDVAHVEKDLEKFLPIQNSNRPDVKVTNFKLVSVAKMDYLENESQIDNNALRNGPEKSATYGPLVLSILILISSCLNFANTTLVRTGNRIKEMGIRKVLGGSRQQLISQQLMETCCIVLVATVVSVALNKWWLPTFNNMFDGIKLEAKYLYDPHLIKWMLILVLFVTLIAGIYPAIYASKTNISSIFRSNNQSGGAGTFSRFLLGLQILISFITVTAGFGFSRNATFQKEYNFGYNHQNAIGVLLKNTEYESFRNDIQDIKGITAMAGSRGHIAYSWRNKRMEAEELKKENPFIEVGDGYLSMMNIKITQGRDFRSASEADDYKSIIISENLSASFNWKPSTALGKNIKIDTILYNVIGVCKDIYMGGFFNAPMPVAFSKVHARDFRHLVVAADNENLKSVHDQLKAKWAKLFPLQPFKPFYQDQLGAEAFNTTKSIAKIFSMFSLVTLLLTATGMFALISLTIQRKTKELAIRKVVGATLKDITLVINKNYFIIFFIASFLGLYAGISLTKLLMDLIFAVNIGVNTLTLVYTFLAVLGLVGTVIGIKVFQMGKMKPSQVLKAQ